MSPCWLSASRNGSRNQGDLQLRVCHAFCLLAAAEVVGGGIAGLVAAPLYGVGAGWFKSMLPWHKSTEAPVGPSGVLVDRADQVTPSRKKDRARNYLHKPTDSANSPDVERQPLETIV